MTLVELLVGISVVGVLMALLLPAIQAAREATRRARCLSNFRQIGLAFHQHDDQKAALPTNGRWDGVQTIPAAGGGPAFTPFTNDYATTTYQWGVGDAGRVPREQTGSWMFALLPFVEQEAVWIGREWWSPVALYVCRSRRSPQALAPVAGDAYGEYGGGGWEWAKTDYAGNGYLVRGSVQDRNPRTLRLTDIADGTSCTVLAGEKAFNPLVQTPRSWYFDEPFFLGGSAGTARRGIVVAPDGPEAPFKDNWGSAHSGGAVFLLADGSARLVSFDVTWHVMSALLTPNGGETIGEY
jgi:type II secretory pathway pseudopilin PulG